MPRLLIALFNPKRAASDPPTFVQFHRLFLNWYRHSLSPSLSPSPTATIASGRLTQRVRWRGESPGILLQMMFAPNAVTNKNVLGSVENNNNNNNQTYGNEYRCNITNDVQINCLNNYIHLLTTPPCSIPPPWVSHLTYFIVIDAPFVFYTTHNSCRRPT